MQKTFNSIHEVCARAKDVRMLVDLDYEVSSNMIDTASLILSVLPPFLPSTRKASSPSFLYHGINVGVASPNFLYSARSCIVYVAVFI